MLQEAISKASGGCANVEAGSAVEGDLPVGKRSRKLQSTAAHVGQVLTQEPHRSIRRHRGSRLVNLLLVDENSTGKDIGARPFAAWNQTALNKQEIDSSFDCWRHGALVLFPSI